MSTEMQTIRDCTLYRGDCLEVLPTLGKVDATVTSPPYDNLRLYGGHTWDFKRVAGELHKATKDGGVVTWIVNDETKNGCETGTSFSQALYFKEIGFRIHDTMIWNKGGCRFPETNRYYPTFEYMFIFSKGKPSTTNLIADRVNIHSGSKVARATSIRTHDGRLIENSAFRIAKGRTTKPLGVRYNVWTVPVASNTDDPTGHPAVFPESLASDHVASWSMSGETILDPFMGSGTTGVACVKLDRKFIGIEIEHKYFDIACKRIEKAYADQALLDLAETVALYKQPSLLEK